MKIAYLFIITLWLSSCKQRFYRAATNSMEETIMIRQSFTISVTDKFERNDIVMFDYFGPDYTSPEEEIGKFKMSWFKKVYRLIAYSGDLLEIKNGEIFVNSRHVPLPPKARVRYKVCSTGQIEEFEMENSYAASRTKTTDTIEYVAGLTEKQALDYRQKKPFIISVERILPSLPHINDTSYARASSAGKWTLDNYGPLRIPSPGDVIVVNKVNSGFYKNIPDIKEGNNTIKEKLYFFLGDNRYGAEDSRFIGLITHSKMYGVVK